MPVHSTTIRRYLLFSYAGPFYVVLLFCHRSLPDQPVFLRRRWGGRALGVNVGRSRPKVYRFLASSVRRRTSLRPLTTINSRRRMRMRDRPVPSCAGTLVHIQHRVRVSSCT